MSKTKTLTLILAIALILSGCVTTQIITADPTPTAPPAASTPLPANGEQAPRTPIIENPAGAVFDIPEYWLIAQPTATPQPKRGRSNYQ